MSPSRKSAKASRRKQPVDLSGTLSPKAEDVAWNITRLTATPAKFIGRVYAPDEATAIARAIEQFEIPEAQRLKLAARRG